MTNTLEELIDQQINLGHKDPHEFYELIHRALGEELIDVVTPYISDFIAELGRQRLNAKRRATLARISAKTLASPDILLRSMWVPTGDGTITYKRIADMTAEDFDERANYLERMAIGIRRSAQWCRECAHAIRSNKVKTAGTLGSLPPLPDHEDLS